MLEGMLSVVVPVSRKVDSFSDLIKSYGEAVARIARSYEFVFVLDGPKPEIREHLQAFRAQGHPVRVFQLVKSFGEAAALSVGFDHARGDVILTLPASFEVEPASLPKLVEALGDSDMVVARRWPRTDSQLSQFKTLVFNRLISFKGEGIRFQDISCGVRFFRKTVADEVPLYGDQDIFFSLLASQRGFVVEEIDLPQSQRATPGPRRGISVYLRRLLDLLTVWFLNKFTRKPLRFFGLIGTAIASTGFLALLFVIIERLFFGVALADRPALLLSSLLVVLGVQVVGMGLVGELVVFTHARRLKEYQVREIVNGRHDPVVLDRSSGTGNPQASARGADPPVKSPSGADRLSS